MKVLPNKGMKLTSAERNGRSQLIPGVIQITKGHDAGMIQWLLRRVARLLIGPDPPQECAPGFDSPEGAVLLLEDAYRRRDVEAAVACKDFAREAALLLAEKPQEVSSDSEVLRKTAEVLELAFRKQLAEAWPDMQGVRSQFLKRYRQTSEFVVVRELCTYPDGRTSQQRINVALGQGGWRVLNPW